MNTVALRKSGITGLGEIPWGTHFCHFYETKKDLLDIVVPFFKAGLQNNEFCVWVVTNPLGVDEAKETLAQLIDHEPVSGTIEIVADSGANGKTPPSESIEILPHTKTAMALR
jgi:hypothetical protein